MKTHSVRVHPSADRLGREDQLAWKLAAMAVDPVPVEADVAAMIINRVIDNAAVAIAAINRSAPRSAREMALAHPREGASSLFGMPASARVSAEWATWANGTAVRELDFHDTFLAADYSHPADNIPAILAVAQQVGASGHDVLRALAAAYEIQVDLVKGICLHEYKIDHIAHLGPSVAGGLGALIGAETETTYQAIQQALHTTTTTRQSRKGEISTWKAFAPAFAGKMGIEAMDRALRGQGAPSPIYEGEDGFIAWMLGGKGATYQVPLPEAGEPKRAILETYTKAHSAEYQSQAPIDLAFRLRQRIQDMEAIEEIVLQTSHHTHYVIGTGSNDPQKFDPQASRETLDHSIMYIFAVALQDGAWHHVHSYAPERAQRPDTVRLWHKIRTEEDPRWTQRYHSQDPREKAFGARAIVRFADGSTIEDELAVADAHPLGARPFERDDYIGKFRTLTEDILEAGEADRFLEAAQSVDHLKAEDLARLFPVLPAGRLDGDRRTDQGLF